MGETSKKRGEFGEKVVDNLLQLIGWNNSLSGREIECYKPEDHSISTRDRKDHGVDFIFDYDCPLFCNTQMFVIISSKINDKYPSNPSTKFKSHLRDIAYAADCFKKSNLRSKLKNTNAIYEGKLSGVVFWIDNESNYDDVIERLTDFKIDDDLEFETIYLVDNKRAIFLFESIKFVKDKFTDSHIEFLHPTIGYNTTAKHRIGSSAILPVQYINSSIIPIKIIKENGDEYLILNCIDNFEEDYLKKLISLSQKLSEGWGQQIHILFPQYNQDTFKDIVDDVKLGFKDQRFVKKITVSTYNLTFRNIESI